MYICRLRSPESFSIIIDSICSSARLIVDSITKSLTSESKKLSARSRFAPIPVQAELEILILIRKKLIHVINSSNRHISCRCRYVKLCTYDSFENRVSYGFYYSVDLSKVISRLPVVWFKVYCQTFQTFHRLRWLRKTSFTSKYLLHFIFWIIF